MNQQQAEAWAKMVSFGWRHDGAAVTLHSLKRGARRKRTRGARCPICQVPLVVGSSASWCPTMFGGSADHVFQAEHVMIGRTDYLAFEAQVPRALYPTYMEQRRRKRLALMPDDARSTRFDREIEPIDQP